MKKVLITGENSYIGQHFVEYLTKYNEQVKDTIYQLDCISQRNEDWVNYDFSVYDTVLDVTGIAYAEDGQLSCEKEAKYYEINSHLAYRTAEKAKAEGVKQFVFLSSILVYGEEGRIGEPLQITEQTVPAPTTLYGKSKLLAEQKISELSSDTYYVTIVRLPFVYGEGCKNSYSYLRKWACWFPLIPTISDEKSMIYIYNLCEFLRLIVENERAGVYCPQNMEKKSTAEILREIRKVLGKRTFACGLLNPLIKLGTVFPGKTGRMFRKAFGGMSFSDNMSNMVEGYSVVDFAESIRETEENRV